jgi:hypothetical protein
MWTKIFAATLLVLVALVAFSATRDTPVRDALLPKPSPAEAALDRVLPEVQIVDVPFDQALERLKALSGVELAADWEELEATVTTSGSLFQRQRPVRLQAHEIRLSDALAALLAQHDHDISFAPDGARVLISGRGALQKKVFMRCYPVRELVPRDVGPPAPMVRIGGVISGIDAPAWPDEAQRGQDVVELVESVVEPETWLTNGGSTAHARYFAGHLVVLQTWEGHRQVEELLRGLRQAAAGPARPALPELLLWNERQRQWLPAGADPAERALRIVLAEVRLDAATLPAAVDELARLARANILLDHAALGEIGFDAGRTLQFRLYGVTLYRALEAVVEGFGTEERLLDFTLQGGAIVVTTHDKAECQGVTRVYDLRDWPQAAAWAQGGKVNGAGVYPSTWAEATEELAKAMMEVVDPDSWRDNGGRAGDMRLGAQRLIVTQTWRNQEKVRRFLDAMRAAPPGPAAAPPATTAASGPAK